MADSYCSGIGIIGDPENGICTVSPTVAGDSGGGRCTVGEEKVFLVKSKKSVYCEMCAKMIYLKNIS